MSYYRITPDRNESPGWRVGELAGIPIFIEPSFLFLVAIIFMFNMGNSSPQQIGLFLVVLFFSILLHEFGHAFASKFFRLHSVRIALHQFGGYTTHSAATTRENLAIVAAGPAVTFILAGLAWLIYIKAPGLMNVGPPGAVHYIVVQMLFLNIFLGIYNMLPVYPMDGGQIMLYLLALKFSPDRALRTTAMVSLVAAVIACVVSYRMGLPFAAILLLGNIMTNFSILQQLPR